MVAATLIEEVTRVLAMLCYAAHGKSWATIVNMAGHYGTGNTSAVDKPANSNSLQLAAVLREDRTTPQNVRTCVENFCYM